MKYCNILIYFVIFFSEKNKPVTPEAINNILKFSLQYLRYEVTTTGTPLTILNIYYRANDSSLAETIKDVTKSTHEFKVVASIIPVVGFAEQEIFLVITGVCH